MSHSSLLFNTFYHFNFTDFPFTRVVWIGNQRGTGVTSMINLFWSHPMGIGGSIRAKWKVLGLAYNWCETRDKRPLGKDLDRSWCHRHTNWKIFLCRSPWLHEQQVICSILINVFARFMWKWVWCLLLFHAKLFNQSSWNFVHIFLRVWSWTYDTFLKKKQYWWKMGHFHLLHCCNRLLHCWK